ncbi:hypothetical protein [Acidovorax sp. sic0104]|uniref:hypothetical protein n=1 Tax=Acidovorax sp. sic0104 TaxID=2854784 RepID=UPI001C45BB16|nr:hypothetical protein [Acidovorax sp. sic0104]MBV7542035.1 hypothetical protein [Acidovorax sp. sic0104]
MMTQASDKPAPSTIRIKDVADWVRRVYASDYYAAHSLTKREWIMEYAGNHGLDFNRQALCEVSAQLIKARSLLATMPEADRFAMMDLTMMVEATLNMTAALNPAVAQVVRALPPLEWSDIEPPAVLRQGTLH